MPRLLVPAIFSLIGGIILRAELIDRIAVSVGNQVITEKQIDEELRVTAFLNHASLDLSENKKKEAAERLIEQALVRREMEISHYPAPETREVEAAFEDVKSGYGSESDFRDALRNYGLTEEQLRSHLLWQITLLRFIDFRFRPAIQVRNSEVSAFYDREAAKLRDEGRTPPSFEEKRKEIEQLLTEQKVDQALDRWLGDARTQVDIRYHQGALE